MIERIISPTAIPSRYASLTLLGEGGMGAVYRAMDRLTAQPVALKRVEAPAEELLFSSQGFGPTQKLALANEFKILSSIRHPNIISVLDYGFEHDAPYFTMNLLEQPIPITRSAQSDQLHVQVGLFLQLLQALTYLHRRKIIHRDLKPTNVLVTTDGQVKVLDFGMRLSQEYISRQQDFGLGTVAYTAPEILKGSPETVQSDLYAVGVM